MLSGRVVDESGRAVGGARIALAGAVRGQPPRLRPDSPCLRTAPDGSFFAPAPEQDSAFRLFAHAPGHGGAVFSPVLPDRPVRVVLEAGRTIEGVLRDRAGRLVAGARVSFLCAPKHCIAPKPLREDASVRITNPRDAPAAASNCCDGCRQGTGCTCPR